MGNVWSKKTTNIDSGSDSPALWRVDLLDFITSANGITTTGEANCLVKTDSAGALNLSNDLQMIAATNTIGTGTSDGFDTKRIFISGGGTASGSRGGNIGVQGNEYPSTGGAITVIGGQTTTGNISFFTGVITAKRLEIKANGNINMGTLPTNTTGLVVGDLWNNSGVLSVV